MFTLGAEGFASPDPRARESFAAELSARLLEMTPGSALTLMMGEVSPVPAFDLVREASAHTEPQIAEVAATAHTPRALTQAAATHRPAPDATTETRVTPS